MDALSPERTFLAEYGQEHTVPVSTDNGRKCTYFTTEFYTGAAITKNDIGVVPLMDYGHMMSIADFYRSGNLSTYFATGTVGNATLVDPRFKFLLKRGVQTSTIRNQSTEAAHITAYYCRPRQHIVPFGMTSGVFNIYMMLAHGFANNDIDPAHIYAANDAVGPKVINGAMELARYTPFQSLDFCRAFKVTKVKKVNLMPSQTKNFRLKVRQQLVRPIDWADTAGTTGSNTWQGAIQKYNYYKQQRFILFKLSSNIAGFGAVQSNYSKLIQTTTPTIVMDTGIRYFTKMIPYGEVALQEIAITGFTDPTSAAHNPAIVVPDAAVVGEEKDAA